MNTHIPQTTQWFLIRILVIIILIGILYGISSLPSGPEIDNNQKTQATFAVITKSETTDFYTLDAQYPSDPRDRNGIITTWAENIINKTQQDWKTGGELQLSEAQLSVEFPDRPQMQYSLNIDYTRHESVKLGTVSYVMQNYEFTGGAHGNTGLKTFTFNDDGIIDLSAVLTINETTSVNLANIIRNTLTQSLGDMSDEGMIRDGLDCAYINDSDTQICDASALAQNLQNFYITDTGITFIFGQYQVAAYAVGMPEVTLTWSELAPFMNTGFDLPLD
jgi:hypothetical protein